MILNIDENRYSRRAVSARRKFLKNFFYFAIICAVSYRLGYESVRSREEAYRKQVESTQKGQGDLESTITSLRSDLQSSQVRYQQLLDKYETDVPKGNHKYLSDMVKHQLDLGIQPERLVSLIRSTRPPQNCDKPVVRRFVMSTPNYTGPKSAVSFMNGAIEVGGIGQSAVSSSGSLEAWYDPNKPVEITFKTTGGKIVKKDGLLPIYHSIIMGNKEVRFTLASGARSFLNVTTDYCDYP